MTKLAAQRLYAKTGVKPTDVQAVELHDCFSANELITYEALGLCPEVFGLHFSSFSMQGCNVCLH